MQEEMTVMDAALLMGVRFVAIFVILIILMICLYVFGYLSRKIAERQAGGASGAQKPSGTG